MQKLTEAAGARLAMTTLSSWKKATLMLQNMILFNSLNEGAFIFFLEKKF